MRFSIKSKIFIGLLMVALLATSVYADLDWVVNPETGNIDTIGKSDSDDDEDATDFVNVTGDTMTGTLNTQDVIPTAHDTYDLASDVMRFKNLYVHGISQIDDIISTLFPYTDDTYDLGRSDKRWRDLYISRVAYINAFGESLLPYTIGLSLGSDDYEWYDLYVDNIAYIDALDCPSITSVSGAISLGDDNISGTGILSMEHLTSTDDATITDTLTVGTFTDGTLSITGGSLSTATGTLTAEQLTSLDDLTVVDTAQIDSTLHLASGSITDDSGAIDFGNEDITIGGTLTATGDIALGATTEITGSIKPPSANDGAFEIGGEDRRYARVCTKEILFDPDTYMIFDGAFIYIYVNGIERAVFGAVAEIHNILYATEQVVYSGENVVW